MANIPITRQSYLIRTKKIVLAEQAARLLEQKQAYYCWKFENLLINFWLKQPPWHNFAHAPVTQ
jgi:hypothetical protein